MTPMTIKDLVNHTLTSNKRLKGFDDISDFGVDVLTEMVRKYTRLKCLEAIKNTRYKAIELVQDHVSCDQSLIRDIQNIHNQDVMPEI